MSTSDAKEEMNYIAKMLWRAAAILRKIPGNKKAALRAAEAADQTARTAI